jgi:hypothetical protein
MSTTANNNNNNQQAESIILQLETLSKQYDTTLVKYQQATTNYVNALQQLNNTSPTFAIIQGNAFWGTGSIASSASSNATTANACSALCSQTTGCSGATFSPNNNGSPTCFLRTGDGNIIPSSSSSYAIVPTIQQYFSNMVSLNEQLIYINEQIMQIVDNQGDEVYTSEVQQRYTNASELQKNYNKLMKEKKQIEKQLNSFDDLDQAQSNSELITNSNYLSYILLLGLVIVCIILLLNISSIFGSKKSSQSSSSFFPSFNNNQPSYNQLGGKLNHTTYYIIFGIMVFIIGCLFYQKYILKN